MLPAQPGEETLVVGFSLFLFFYFTRNLSPCTMKFKSGAGLLRILIYAPVASNPGHLVNSRSVLES